MNVISPGVLLKHMEDCNGRRWSSDGNDREEKESFFMVLS